ncbi:MAG: hypothetical protein RMJ98_08400 [Myxococcales bacterium]|nr:hypothetical protein [Polyangiaceae bacterium]MDW8249307.1 hypothetical protein [Myxococcales bacterium]
MGFLLALLCSGCGLTARALSSPEEYEAYRTTRVGYTTEARLQAAKVYLGRYPEGRFAEEVRRRFEVEEGMFYRASSRTKHGLDWYLQTLPDGPHATEANLMLLELARREAAEQEDELVKRGRSIERRLAQAERLRREVVEALVGWISALASSQAWGKPTWEQPTELLQGIRGLPEPGRCDDLRCTRTRTMEFLIPAAGGGLEERAAIFDFVLELDQGRVIRGLLQGPALFSRFYEASQGRLLPRDPLEARAEAVGYALEVVSGAFEAVAPGATCHQGITPPVVLSRRCGGWKVTVTAGDGAAEDDRLEVEGPRRP